MSRWRPIKSFRGPTSRFGRKVDLWLSIYASPRSMGMADDFRVVDCWRKDGKWFHEFKGEETELFTDYVTHWLPIPRPPSRRGS